jgi:hypothetical protein
MGHVHDASLSLNSFSFPRKCAQLNEREREREKELGVGKERENFVFVGVLFCFVLFCVECRGREEREAKQLSGLSWK